ncbi:MAG: hypothetical protein JWP98_1859, partial [Edaphobacter sp.]|nr:hypothetical protein [Edaphobacter sp.]
QHMLHHLPQPIPFASYAWYVLSGLHGLLNPSVGKLFLTLSRQLL